MQCKDISEIPILQWLAAHTNENRWSTHYQSEDITWSFAHIFPEEANWKLRLAKLKGLVKRGLVDGCTCGCRGDWYITAEGREYLEHYKVD